MTESEQELPSGEFTSHEAEVELERHLLAAAAFPEYQRLVKAAHPEAHAIFLTSVEPGSEPFRFKLRGMWRSIGENEAAKDKELAPIRLRTRGRAQAYLNQILSNFMTEQVEGFKRQAHAGETPDDRRDAHLVVEAAQQTIALLERASVDLLAKEAPVLLVYDGGKPDAAQGAAR